MPGKFSYSLEDEIRHLRKEAFANGCEYTKIDARIQCLFYALHSSPVRAFTAHTIVQRFPSLQGSPKF